MDYKALLGIIAVILGFAGYYSYLRDIFKGTTKPHAFTWLVWGVLTGIAFLGQVSEKGGPGTWVTGFTGVVCLGIFVLALFKGSKDFPWIDWVSLAGAGLGILLWLVTKDALLAVILVTIIDAIGFVPTYRKSISRPYEETMFSYIMGGTKYIFGIAALEHFSLVTVLFPASLVLSNGIFVTMLIIRRKQIPSR